MTIEEKKKCFVIMPFSQSSTDHTEEYWNSHFNNFLKPLIESVSLEPYRSNPLRSDIVEQIVKDLIMAPVVVADLTDANPNVYWELGIRQSFRYCTITIAQQGTPLPFNIGRKGTLYYSPSQATDSTTNTQFLTRFKEALLDCISNPETPDSVVLQTITGRATLYQIMKKDETLRKLTALKRESEFNRHLLDTVKGTCSSNFGLRALKRYKECKVITARLSLVCLENLLVNRYVDTDNSFYEHADKYFSYGTAYSEQLSTWQQEASNAEEWLTQHSKHLKPFMEEFAKLVENEINLVISKY